MSYIGKNIKTIRTVKNLSQAAFAQLFNLARPSVGAYEEGRSEPKMETLALIARHFNLSIDLLITKELTVNELYAIDIFKKELKNNHLLKMVAPPEVDTNYDTAIIYSHQLLEYAMQHYDADFIRNLPTARFPNTNHILTRAFELSGSEMQYQETGLRHGDILYAEPVETEAYKNMATGLVYVVVLPTQIYIRRLQEISEPDRLLLKADNPDYAMIEVNLADVREIWRVCGVYSTNLKPSLKVEERLALLENTIGALTKRLDKLENI